MLNRIVSAILVSLFLLYKLVGRTVQNVPARSTQKLLFRPAWALGMALLTLVLLVSAPVAVKALQQLLGYVPGVALVDSSTHMRVLTEPVSQTRDGITLTIENVFVFDDRVELIYEVKGIDPQNDGALDRDAVENPTAFC